MSIKILLADDSITIQKVVGIIFGGDDYSLTVVDNGKSALEKARELVPDVLLIDALMPGMTGYEVCEAVRATPLLATKPILLLTGSFEPFDENKARTCGADDFIAKPFESQQIVNKVKELFELGKSRAATAAPAVPEAPVATFVPPLAAPAAVAAAPTPPTPPAAEAFGASPFESTPFESNAFESTAFESAAFAPIQEVPVTPVPVSAAPVTPVAAEPATTAAVPGIWDAFTTIEAPAAPAWTPAAEPVPMAPQFPAEDVFAMVQEEPETVVTPEPAAIHANHTGTQWVPVEEQTYEFMEEKVAEIPADAFAPAPEFEAAPAFGEISFAPEPPELMRPTEPPVAAEPVADVPLDSFANFEPTVAPAVPETTFAPAPASFNETSFELPAEPVQPAAAVMAAAAVTPVTDQLPALTEEQLKAALSSVSKEVIERIVWEVVPDLAELLIKEAIRKIKDGI